METSQLEQNLEALLTGLDSKSTIEQFVRDFEEAVQVILLLKADVEDQSAESKALVASAIQKLNARLATVKDGNDYILTAKDKKQIAQLIDVPVVTNTVETIVRELPTFTEIIKEVAITDTPEVTRDKLETLKGDDRLDKSAVKGMDELERKIEKTAKSVTTGFSSVIRHDLILQDEGTALPLRAKVNFKGAGVTVTDDGANDAVIVTIPGGGGTGSGHTVQDEGISLTQRTNLNFIGSAVTATDDAVNDATIVTIQGGGGATYEAPTGTVDDTNTSFTVLNEPLYIVINGNSYRVGHGLYASYSSGTITLTSPIGTGGFIESWYTGTTTAGTPIGEAVSGTINSTNVTFTLSHTPSPASFLQLQLGRQPQIQNVDYTISGATITYTTAPDASLTGLHYAYYIY